MAGLTSNGFEIKRYDTILQELNDGLSNNLGRKIDTSVNSVAGIMNSIVSLQLASLWEQAQNVYDGSSLLSAEGAQLDNLALLQGLTRLSALSTRGISWFTGDNGVQISTFNLMNSLAGDVFKPEKDFSITTTSCIECVAQISLLVPDSIYQLTINGATFTHSSTESSTIETIRDALVTALGSASGVFSATAVGTDQIRIRAVDTTQALSVTGTSYITFSQVITPAIIVSEQLGFISGDALAITNIQTPVNGWASVSNPTDLNLGRNQETDVELRARVLESYASVGSGTPDTVVQRVLGISNVQSAHMYENVRWATDTSLIPNLPPKSYTVTVHDGDTQDIGQMIWDTKPAGVQTVGNTSVVAVDRFGQNQTVYFSRPTIQYVWIKISYSKYSEEDFPSDGETRMKQACLVFGDALDIDNDIIPNRFLGEIYRNVQGIDTLTVQIAITPNVLITDPDDAALTYTTARIPISNAQVSSFGTARMVVTEV